MRKRVTVICKHHPAVFMASLLVLAASSAARSAALAPGTPSWSVRTTWNIEVTYHGRGAAEKENKATPVPFWMHVLDVGAEAVEGTECWKLMFVGGKDAPATLGPTYILFVNQQSGWPLKVARILGPTSLAVDQVGGVSFVPGAAEFPLEVFPLQEVNVPATLASPSSFRVRKQMANKNTVWEATYVGADKKETRVRQVWIPGEKWWSEYQRFVAGRLDLHAKRLRETPISPGPAPAPDGADARKALEAERRMLRREQDLQALVTVNGEDPGLTDILRRLGDATALRFVVDDRLAEHAPLYGSVQMRTFPPGP